MLNAGTRRFDLYDFFSIFIPGAAVILGFLPFYPKDMPTPTGATIAIVIIGGFVVGRGIHAAALWAEQQAGAVTHRQIFRAELKSPSCLSPDLAREFYDDCLDAFEPEGLPEEWEQLDSKHDDELDALYTLVRSYIHMDARGRSRTFQAVLDFYRSIWVGSFVVAAFFMGYALFSELGALNGIVEYQTYYGSLGVPSSITFYGAVFIVGGAYGTFERVRSDYREFYIQYLFSDFVVLQADRTHTSQPPQTPPPQNR
ncbi:hypothetical protein [Haloferax volcanii]|uniref:hypothetical protein n=1 Tax=Haloferax volcanii TaxID=2246 RepID=UPI00249A5ADB|nr:hypothetical protein [Haloferax alexandrinus]